MKHPRKKPLSEINVVPYIDVMLVLLVIFMITAPMISQGIQVSLPQTESSELSTPQTPIIVSVDQNGRLFLNVSDNPQQPIKPSDLLTRVSAELEIAKEKKENRPVFVKGDQAVNYGQVVKTMGLLQKAGVDNVGLMTQLQESLE
jgi:biopolymer transport protein TolR